MLLRRNGVSLSVLTIYFSQQYKREDVAQMATLERMTNEKKGAAAGGLSNAMASTESIRQWVSTINVLINRFIERTIDAY